VLTVALLFLAKLTVECQSGERYVIEADCPCQTMSCCVTGPVNRRPGYRLDTVTGYGLVTTCMRFDWDGDGDVDMRDVARWQEATNVP